MTDESIERRVAALPLDYQIRLIAALFKSEEISKDTPWYQNWLKIGTNADYVRIIVSIVNDHA